MVGVGTTSPMESAFGSIAALAQPYEMLSLLKGVWLEQACDSGSLVAGSISLHQTALKVSALNSRCPCMAAVKARSIVVDHCLRWLSHFLVESPNCVAHIIAVQSAHMCLAAIFFFAQSLSDCSTISYHGESTATRCPRQRASERSWRGHSRRKETKFRIFTAWLVVGVQGIN